MIGKEQVGKRWYERPRRLYLVSEGRFDDPRAQLVIDFHVYTAEESLDRFLQCS